MSYPNPTGDERLAPLDLPAAHEEILCVHLRCWLAGVREDLQEPDRLKDPELSRREADSYERLLAALASGRLMVPDEEARTFLAAAARSNDAANEYARAKAEHDALQSLLVLLESAGPH